MLKQRPALHAGTTYTVMLRLELAYWLAARWCARGSIASFRVPGLGRVHPVTSGCFRAANLQRLLFGGEIGAGSVIYLSRRPNVDIGRGEAVGHGFRHRNAPPVACVGHPFSGAADRRKRLAPLSDCE